MRDFILGLLMALIVISPFLPLVFGYIARVQCENDKNECNDKGLCYLYDEGCEKFPGFKTKSGYGLSYERGRRQRQFREYCCKSLSYT